MNVRPNVFKKIIKLSLNWSFFINLFENTFNNRSLKFLMLINIKNLMQNIRVKYLFEHELFKFIFLLLKRINLDLRIICTIIKKIIEILITNKFLAANEIVYFSKSTESIEEFQTSNVQIHGIEILTDQFFDIT